MSDSHTQTSERQGDAWGHYSYIGRVRPWDGLIVIVRVPVSVVRPQHFHLGGLTHTFYQKVSADGGRGKWIFKGYVHEHNLVGRWRDTVTPIEQVGLEGCFVWCKKESPSEDSD